MKRIISIVIVTYNSSCDIIDCLESIRPFYSKGIEIIVIDNNSDDGTVELLKSFGSNYIKIIENKTNQGFSKACNQGVKYSKGDIIYFCNPDTIIIDDIFSIAIDQFNNENVGCFSPSISYSDGLEAPFAFRFPHPPFSLLKAFVRNLLRKSNAKILQINYFSKSTVIKCDWVLGACLFVRRSIFESIGGYDEDFFLYFEDVDLCKRIKMAGYKIVADRRGKIIHHKYGSSKSVEQQKIIKFRLSSEYLYYKKHHGIKGQILSKNLDKEGYLFRA